MVYYIYILKITKAGLEIGVKVEILFLSPHSRTRSLIEPLVAGWTLFLSQTRDSPHRSGQGRDPKFFLPSLKGIGLPGIAL